MSEQTRDKAHYLCEVCKDKGKLVYKDIEVHHIVKIKDDSSQLLNPLNLLCLCQSCHKEADAGKIDPDYLRQLAKKREEESW